LAHKYFIFTLCSILQPFTANQDENLPSRMHPLTKSGNEVYKRSSILNKSSHPQPKKRRTFQNRQATNGKMRKIIPIPIRLKGRGDEWSISTLTLYSNFLCFLEFFQDCLKILGKFRISNLFAGLYRNNLVVRLQPSKEPNVSTGKWIPSPFPDLMIKHARASTMPTLSHCGETRATQAHYRHPRNPS
jgi:hypothetical protein